MADPSTSRNIIPNLNGVNQVNSKNWGTPATEKGNLPVAPYDTETDVAQGYL